MGVDITLFPEHRTADGVWSPVDELLPNLDYFPDDPDFAAEPAFVPNALDISRCSALFAILADVNNTRTATPYTPISKPRGLPSDAAEATRRWFNSWDSAFAPSWLTISEIDSYDWDQVAQHYGKVDHCVAHLFRDNPLGFPFAQWPKDVPFSYSECSSDSGNARWRATHGESAGFKWFRELLVPYDRLPEVRLVFWFDH